MAVDQKYIDQATSQLTPTHNSQVTSLKNQLAQDNNIPLVRIPYWERDNITFEMLFSNKYQIR